MEMSYEHAAAILRESRRSIAVTGAGISVESGIPDFRSPTGIWSKYPPEHYATIDAYLANPPKVWRFWRELAIDFAECGPNPAHFALATLENHGYLKAVVTQNIDALHQAAGSKSVVEYHGSARNLFCLDCGAERPMDIRTMSDTPPLCPVCNGLMKPGIVMFGELIPQEALRASAEWGETCDAVLIVGTSAQVYPAADLPYMAKRNGARIIEANIERTSFTETITDVFLQGPAGETLPRLVHTLGLEMPGASAAD
ncbi:MAG TPA: NAD-dependent deacylase [Candidatus Hydrogenedentes bacterium]|jgi:NAD-dependent deacetylase|nr:NAD-dependent deacylase [Candidatus Hydrogenedentota bacterium]